ncbi:hypothetical protein Cfor_00345 [Coptotermes formosanus]|uniref:poly(ADP-ribose) glycohydrolase n=1 Tax=Coptotermes formosanus TaxID=36987 RepID=A0A6L2PBX8_COPFO|nr:hypothetical protein Cfor_00345 [Coptotermes formosanus]
MALVILPCDLPWWPTVQRHLTQLSLARNSKDLIENMQKIHNICNIGLDPDDDDKPDLTVFGGLEIFLDSDMTEEERCHFLEVTAPSMVHKALQLKQLKPAGGFHFSLQQQADRVELERGFIASLLAHAFFSTFPKRTIKTHPTLQDFNFTSFFKHLNMNSQKAKLRSILYYFDKLEAEGEPQGRVTYSRQLMTSKEWLTIEDWLESGQSLCPLAIRHEGRLERAENSFLNICFTSSRLGGHVLADGSSQECMQFCIQPELLAILPYVEALEDNEVLSVDGLLQVARISDPHNKAIFEPLAQIQVRSVCCMDAENYLQLPVSQFEEDNVLRELNKAVLAFRQQAPPQPCQPVTRRLSPIGESFSSTPPEGDAAKQQVHQEEKACPPATPVIQQVESSVSQKEWLRPPSPSGRRGRFIVLGSSGECLPVSRQPLGACSLYSSCNSTSAASEEFHSACTSLDTEDNESEDVRRYSAQLDTPERRSTFAERLRDALCRETQSTSTTDSSYAVGISSMFTDAYMPPCWQNICHQQGGSTINWDFIDLHTLMFVRVRRGGSRGFMLHEDSLDDQFLRESLQQEREWIDKFRNKRPGALSRLDTSNSSKFSFSTEYSSELEELYEQYSRWLDDVDENRELDARDIAVVRFAGSLLKRTLSDSFAGVPLTEGQQGPLGQMETDRNRTKLALVARSLSLELARHKHRLTSQLVSCKLLFSYSRGIIGLTKLLLSAHPFPPFTSVLYMTIIKNYPVTFISPPPVTSISHQLFLLYTSQYLAETSCSGSVANQSQSASGLHSVATGNWGCGSSQFGDPQLKLVVQWLAASVAGVPCLYYYTCGHHRLLKLDTVCRVLLDRQWTVGELVNATLRFAQTTLDDPSPPLPNHTLFDELIGAEKSAVPILLETSL